EKIAAVDRKAQITLPNGTAVNVLERTGNKPRVFGVDAVTGKEVLQFYRRPQVVNSVSITGTAVVDFGEKVSDIAGLQETIKQRGYEGTELLKRKYYFDSKYNILFGLGIQGYAVDTNDKVQWHNAWKVVEELLPNGGFDIARAVDAEGIEQATISELPEGGYLMAVNQANAKVGDEVPDIITYEVNKTGHLYGYKTIDRIGAPIGEMSTYRQRENVAYSDFIGIIEGLAPDASLKQKIENSLIPALEQIAGELNVGKPQDLVFDKTRTVSRLGAVWYEWRIKGDGWARVVMSELRDPIDGIMPTVTINYKWENKDPAEGLKLTPYNLPFIVRSNGYVEAGSIVHGYVEQFNIFGIDAGAKVQEVGEIPYVKVGGNYVEATNAAIKRYLIPRDPLYRHIAKEYPNGNTSIVKWWVKNVNTRESGTIEVPLNIEPGLIIINRDGRHVLRETEYSGKQGEWLIYNVLEDILEHGIKSVGGYNLMTGMNFEKRVYNEAPKERFILYHENIPIYSEVPEAGISVPNGHGYLYSQYQGYYKAVDGDLHIAIREEIKADSINEKIKKMQITPTSYGLVTNWETVYTKNTAINYMTVNYPTEFSVRDQVGNSIFGLLARGIKGIFIKDNNERLIDETINENNRIGISYATVQDKPIYQETIVTSGEHPFLKTLNNIGKGLINAIAHPYTIITAMLALLAAFVFAVAKAARNRRNRTTGREGNINTASEDGLIVLGFDKIAAYTIFDFRVKNGLIANDNLGELENKLRKAYTPRSPPQKIINKIRKEVASVSSPVSVNPLLDNLLALGIAPEDVTRIKAIVNNWVGVLESIPGSALNIEEKIAEVIGLIEKYHAGNIDNDFLKKRFLSLLHDRLFFVERGEMRPEVRAYLENRIESILAKLGLSRTSEEGRINKFKQALLLQIAYAPFYELLWPDATYAAGQVSPSIFVTSSDNLSKNPLAREEWDKFLETLKKN
ncbi:MAG: hypothetical protein PHY56_07650, partial [Candidatus Omnitrophica bacterium]|nr:hypothetical protein [Candidatus Omnitrophota bacterium]